MPSLESSSDVIVVGGGLAGTRAAARLRAAGASVLLLEARDRLGGRVCTRALGGVPFDFGGQFIGPGQPRMHDMVASLGLRTFPTYATGRKVIELEGRVRSYAGTVPFRNPFKLVALHLALSRLERLARGVPAADPWSAARARELDALTLEAAQRHARALAGADVNRLSDAVVRLVFGAEPGELSLLHFLWYVSSNGGLMPLVETRGGFQQDRIAGGAQQLAERLAAALAPEAVRLGVDARAMRQDAGGVTVEAASGSWRARRAVVAVPLPIAGRITFDPPLPEARERLHRGAAMGGTVKVLATYARPFWRERGYSGEAVGTSGLVSAAFDNTPHDGSPPCLLAFAAGRNARAFSSMPPGERRATVLEELARFFGPEARAPADYAEMDWGAEPFSGGCPVGHFPPGVLSACGEALRAPAGRIHWAGTETARACAGYMEGALESGDRAADEVLAVL